MVFCFFFFSFSNHYQELSLCANVYLGRSIYVGNVSVFFTLLFSIRKVDFLLFIYFILIFYLFCKKKNYFQFSNIQIVIQFLLFFLPFFFSNHYQELFVHLLNYVSGRSICVENLSVFINLLFSIGNEKCYFFIFFLLLFILFKNCLSKSSAGSIFFFLFFFLI